MVDFYKEILVPAITNTSKIPRHMNGTYFTGMPYEILEETSKEFMTIFAGGRIEAAFPYQYACTRVPCYLLLYTENGLGRFWTQNTIKTLGKNTLLLFPCDESFQLEIALAPWTFYIYFIDGSLISCFQKLLQRSETILYSLEDTSMLIPYMKRLANGKRTATILNKVKDARILNELFSELVMKELEEKEKEDYVPDFIEKMKKAFDTSFQEPFFLEELESQYGISKYRLCREFSKYYGKAPLQYVNFKRIEMAKELLLSTDMKIYEIGYEIGIENTNHFINLFKKETGVTPLSYRRKQG